MYDLNTIQSDLKITFIAMINQHQLKEQGKEKMRVRRNWPEPDHRKIISHVTLAQFSQWFQNDFPILPEVSPFCPITGYRYEVATSGSTDGVHDLKISRKDIGETIFNYHVQVTNE